MNGPPPGPPRPTPPPRWRMLGPGLAMLVLGGVGLVVSTSRPDAPQAPVPQEPAPGPMRSAAPLPPPRPASSPPAPVTQTSEATEPEDTATRAQREAARESARQYRAGRFNAFFRKAAFIEEFSRQGPTRIHGLREELADPSALRQLAADARFLEDKPEPVLERMAMIDLLFELAPSEPAARDAMTSLALSPIDRGLPDSVKKGLVGEKYDLLFRLAQVDRQLAVDTFAKLESPKLKNLLREALIAGLAESGASPDEVQRMTAHL
ncbi:hypothetical protein MYSTI_00608 [Myxococcus stipitatus DSM 14675]|uniref:Uncharacterized protein n=1 Tax=Myxococcus stipitatus (strain DSM 14675 / JCM 12634 / Mx s8) TaxID=1278073 RepID=L7U1A5_MYXSD|nr:hypothetical protein [Myxococcus stipitatus]AGC41958.1 hypothetical protein MYSTI_00608 [Myxococcus stipitatus DSM 14675]